jgi:Uma2 family endonuclease
LVETTLESLTLEEFLQLPQTQLTSEYIDNQIIQKPMPLGQLFGWLLLVWDVLFLIN